MLSAIRSAPEETAVRKIPPAFLRLAVFAGGLVAVVGLLIAGRAVFMPLLVGLGLAYLLDPAVTWFTRHGRSRLFGIVAITLALALAAAGLVLYVVPTIAAQVQHLAASLPRYAAALKAQFLPWLAGLEERFPSEYAEVRRRTTEALRENLPRLAAALSAWMARVLSSLANFLLFLLDLVFVPVFAYYLLIDFPAIKRRALDLVPLPYRATTLARAREVDAAISGFVRGQTTVAAVLAVLNSIGLMILGVPLGLAIGLAAGLANVIPYMSLAVGLLPAAALCWAEYQSGPRLLGVVALFAATQLFEGAFLSPRILGRSVDLHPVWVLLAIIVGGNLFGLFGMLIAVPAAAAIQVFARHWIAAYQRSRLFLGDAADPLVPPTAPEPGFPAAPVTPTPAI
jgi:predicted PurR-regulated permease PerM